MRQHLGSVLSSSRWKPCQITVTFLLLASPGNRSECWATRSDPAKAAGASESPLAGLRRPFASSYGMLEELDVDRPISAEAAVFGSISTWPIPAPVSSGYTLDSAGGGPVGACLPRRSTSSCMGHGPPPRHACRSRLRARWGHRGDRLSAFCPAPQTVFVSAAGISSTLSRRPAGRWRCLSRFNRLVRVCADLIAGRRSSRSTSSPRPRPAGSRRGKDLGR